MSFQTTPLTPIHPLTLVSIQFFFLSWPPCCVSQISSHRQISQNTRSSACLESLPLMENKKNAEVLREKKKCWFYFKLRAGLHQTCWNITSLGKAKRRKRWIMKQSAHNHQTVFFDSTLLRLSFTLLTDYKGWPFSSQNTSTVYGPVFVRALVHPKS